MSDNIQIIAESLYRETMGIVGHVWRIVRCPVIPTPNVYRAR